MKDLFGNRSFRAVARDALSELGGRSEHDQLVKEVKRRLTLAEYEAWLVPAFRRAVLGAVKSPAGRDGEEAVYGVGAEVAVLRMFSVEEFTDKARSLARLSRANRAAVYDLAEVCHAVHGASFDPAEVIREVEAA